jgi:hypothetical protein
VDRVHISVDRSGVLGPLWTDGGADRGEPRHGGALTGAWPLAAPVRQSSPAGAQKGERSTGTHRSLGGAVEAGRQWCRTERRRCSVRTLLKRGERGKEAGEGVVLLGGGALLLYWPGERRGGVAGAVNTGVNGFNAIEDGEGFKREMKARW